MKNLSLILNAVLAVALGVLFKLHFTLRNEVNKINSQPVAAKSGVGQMVFVNMDSLYVKYDQYADVKAQMEEKQKKMEAELAVKKNSYERAVADYQEKAQKGLLLRSEMAKIEQQLMSDQQNLQHLAETLQGQLAEESQVANRKLFNSLVEYLKEYNKNGKFPYIISHAYGSNLLYASDSLDITNDVIKGLNEKYKSEHKK